MAEPVITVENLGKRYRLTHEARLDTLRDALTHGIRGLLRLGKSGNETTTEDFWALRDVSFNVNQGDVVGIIGRNGAGKSTLLKILSRITEPTTGRIRIRGRVASLLEVGTGFHPELSGRENIFLNGAILGMSRAEIRRKFDEIVAFAEVERFLDTPVKHYSSGMYVRLAFAVAAHLEPEILIVDEVLAVGDAAFQQKCLGKIRSVASNEGRTVLLVTHNPSIVLSLCNRAFYLQNGRVNLDGEPAAVVAKYLTSVDTRDIERAIPASARIAITKAAVVGNGVEHGFHLNLKLHLHCRSAIQCAVEIRLHDQVGQPVAFASLGSMIPAEQISVLPGDSDVGCRLDLTGLASGQYGVSLRLTVPFVETLDDLPHCLMFEYESTPAPGMTHVLRQDWGSGYFTLPATRTA
jgi:lipopolysaccharide transport system ATP-binding protein